MAGQREASRQVLQSGAFLGDAVRGSQVVTVASLGTGYFGGNTADDPYCFYIEVVDKGSDSDPKIVVRDALGNQEEWKGFENGARYEAAGLPIACVAVLPGTNVVSFRAGLL